MFTAFSTALSALSASTTAVDVVSNNLANMNTIGYKASSVAFRDLVTESVGAGLGETQVGFGTATPLTQRHFMQGAVQGTGGLLDAAIQGDGFFITENNTGAQLFSRAGNFQTDGQGYLMSASGEEYGAGMVRGRQRRGGHEPGDRAHHRSGRRFEGAHCRPLPARWT